MVSGSRTLEPAPERDRPGRGGRAARNAAVLSGATLAARLLGFALGVVLGRTLGVEDYGVYGFAVALSLVVTPLADVGITQYMIRETARDAARAEAEMRDLLRVKLALAVAVLAIVAAVALLRSRDSTVAVVVIVIAAAGLGDSFSQFVFGYFQGRERMGFEARLTTFAALLRAAGGIVLALVTRDLVLVVCWVLAVSVFQVGVAFARVRAPLRETRGRWAAAAWGTVLVMGAIVALTNVYTRADAVMIGLLLDDRQVGLYTAAYTLMLGLGIVPWMVGTALAPVFASTFTGDREVFAQAWREGVRATLVIAIPLALVTSILARPILERLYGPEFGDATTALAVLAWTCPLAALATLSSVALRGAGRERWILLVALAGAVMNVGLNLVLIPAIGIKGAAIMTVATEVMVVLAMAGLATARRLLPRPRLPLLRMLAAAAALAAVAVGLRDAPVEVSVIASMAAYVLVALATRLVGPEDIARIRQARAA